MVRCANGLGMLRRLEAGLHPYRCSRQFPSAFSRAAHAWRPRSRDALRPTDACAYGVPVRPRTEISQRWQDRPPTRVRGGPTALGVGTLAAASFDAFVHDKAGSVPRGGAPARSKRLAGSFARLAACKRKGDEEGCAHGQGRDELRQSGAGAPARPRAYRPTNVVTLPAAASAANRGWSMVTSGSDFQASVSLVRTDSTRVPHTPADPSSKRTV